MPPFNPPPYFALLYILNLHKNLLFEGIVYKARIFHWVVETKYLGETHLYNPAIE